MSTAAVTPPDLPRDYSGVEYVFEPHSTTLPNLRTYLEEMWERRAFMRELARTSLKGARANTFFGPLWAVLDPLFQAIIYFILFSTIRGGGDAGTAQILALIFGIFMFTYTSSALNDGGRAIIKGKGLLLNSTFPRALLPLSSIYKGMLNLIPTLALYAVLHVLTGQPVGAALLVLPLLFAIHTVLNIGIALVVSTLTVLIRDTSQFLAYVNRILLFTAPIIYPVSNLTPMQRKALSFNPIFALFAAYREILAARVPSIGLIIQACVWAALFLVVGAQVFLRHERAFALKL